MVGIVTPANHGEVYHFLFTDLVGRHRGRMESVHHLVPEPARLRRPLHSSLLRSDVWDQHRRG